MPLAAEIYNFAYNDEAGNEIRSRATLFGKPELINPKIGAPLKISNFRRWRDGEPEPVIGE